MGVLWEFPVLKMSDNVLTRPLEENGILTDISFSKLAFKTFQEEYSKHRKNCECCHHHSIFKGHNVIVHIVVLNCQKCNQCLKCQVSGHKNFQKIWKFSANLKCFPKICQNCKNCQKLSKLSKLSKIIKNCQKCSKLLKIVKIVKNVKNCQNCKKKC